MIIAGMADRVAGHVRIQNPETCLLCLQDLQFLSSCLLFGAKWDAKSVLAVSVSALSPGELCDSVS